MPSFPARTPADDAQRLRPDHPDDSIDQVEQQIDAGLAETGCRKTGVGVDARFCCRWWPVVRSGASRRCGCAGAMGGCGPACGGPAPRLATRRRTLLLSRSALRAPLHLVPSAADRPRAAGRPGRWPGAVQPRVGVLCSSPHAPRPRAGFRLGSRARAINNRAPRSIRRSWRAGREWSPRGPSGGGS